MSVREQLRQLWPSAIELLLLAALAAGALHNFWLMDDAFIYFRYLDNLLFLGRGLVFNPGEYVEGFSSPLWLFVLLPLRWLQLDYWTICRGLALLFALALGALLIACNRALRPSGSPAAINLPLAIAAGHYGITTHCSSGLETPLVQLWAALIALWLLRPASRALQIAAGLAPLIRPELALVVLPASVFCALRMRRVPRWFAASLFGFNAAWLTFRVYYYAELLPNTFYLKNGDAWLRGFWYLANGVVDQWWVPLVALAWIAAIAAPRPLAGERAHGAERLLMIGTAALQLLWVARIGGDMVYHRFLAAPTVLLLCSTGGIGERVLARALSAPRAAIAGNVLALCAFAASFASYPPQLNSHPWTSGVRSMQWHGIEDATWHRRHPQLAPKPTRSQDDQALLASYQLWLHPPRPLDPAIAHPWCRRAFFEFARVVVHSYGLTDPVLSRIDVPLKRAGHRQLDHFPADVLNVVAHANPRDAGMFRRAVMRGEAAPWIADNLDTVELIASKAYNHHELATNLRLAFTRVPRIRP
jgi:hypothetical protein